MSGPAEFDGKVAIVTGGERGIGRDCVLQLAAASCSVCAFGIDGPALAALSAECAANGWNVTTFTGDVSKAASVADAVAHAVAQFGGIDILINNAGIASTGTVETVDEAEWDRVMAVNLKGPYLLARAVIPEMRKRGRGAIVNVASLHGFTTASGRGVYTASKAGLLGLTRVMALDHGLDDIRVNAVCPGFVETDMLRTAWPQLHPNRPAEEVIADLAADQPLGRLGQSSDVADAIVFLCSNRADFITGADIKVDGGALCRLYGAPPARRSGQQSNEVTL